MCTLSIYIVELCVLLKYLIYGSEIIRSQLLVIGILRITDQLINYSVKVHGTSFVVMLQNFLSTINYLCYCVALSGDLLMNKENIDDSFYKVTNLYQCCCHGSNVGR